MFIGHVVAQLNPIKQEDTRLAVLGFLTAAANWARARDALQTARELLRSCERVATAHVERVRQASARARIMLGELEDSAEDLPPMYELDPALADKVQAQLQAAREAARELKIGGVE